MTLRDAIDEEETWLDGLFTALREEAVALSADFGTRLKHKIDQVADSQGIHPPSTVGLLLSVSLETTNIVGTVAASLQEDDLSEEDT